MGESVIGAEACRASADEDVGSLNDPRGQCGVEQVHPGIRSGR